MQRLSVRDLGRLDGPVLVFGGPYGNLQATTALRRASERAGIAPSHVICTGDLVAYCGQPRETVALVRDWGIPVVMGNCEESLATGADGCGCGFAPGSACDALSTQWYAHARAELDTDATAWMGRLPRLIVFTLGGARFAVLHGGADHISRFVFASATDADLAADLDTTHADAVVAGHAGLPFERVLEDGRLWLNAGVVGMPANDGTPRVWYTVLNPGPDGISIARHALAYDHAAAARALRAAGQPKPYARCLENGLWPNQDVLAPAERALRGRRLAETRLTWAPPAAVAPIAAA